MVFELNVRYYYLLFVHTLDIVVALKDSEQQMELPDYFV